MPESLAQSCYFTILNKVDLHFLHEEGDKDKRRVWYFKSSKDCESFLVGGSVIFVAPFLFIDFFDSSEEKEVSKYRPAHL